MNMKKLIIPASLVLVVLALAFTGCMEKSGEEGVETGAVLDEEAVHAEEGATGSEDEIVNITEEACEDRPIKLTTCPPEPELLGSHES